MARGLHTAVNFTAQYAIMFGIGGAVAIESNLKICEVAQVLLATASDEGFWCDALTPSADHDGRAMGVVGTDIATVVTAHFLKANPKIRLQILDKMPEVNIPVGIRTSRSYKNAFQVEGPSKN